MNRDQRHLRKMMKKVRKCQKAISGLSDQELANLTDGFKARLQQGETLDSLMPEAFAAMCEADERILGLAPYDVQIMGAVALHEGCLAEMGTGEGKTLVATMPLYLNALAGGSSILVTANEYLALRDYQEIGPVYRFMGLTVAAGVQRKQDVPFTNDEKREIYAADILYTTHGAVGFDYLLNNLVSSAEERFLRPFNFIVIDEADSVLLDAAQTPLVISGSPRVQSNLYSLANLFVTLLDPETDFEAEEQKVWLTESGVKYAERFFGIDNFYGEESFEINRHVTLALRAHALFEKERDYSFSDSEELILLDRGTGRIMPGVKLRGGQQQALEAKEGRKESMETRSVAAITYQNLFLLFPKMSGISGTIAEARDELVNVYGTKVVVIPPNRPVIRQDLPDVFLPDEDAKFRAAIHAILEYRRLGRPVLAVVSTIAETERVSRALHEAKVPHNVLNANNAFWEASMIKEAGRLNAVTVATTMAGRGTDIKLDREAERLGGLVVVGIGRMANARMERQVRGRSGRQGDPGLSQFFVALSDEVVIRSLPELVEKYHKKGKKLRQKQIRKVVNRAQALEEEYAIRSRKNAMDYDQIIKKQRQLIYDMRNRLLDGGTIGQRRILRIAEENIRRFVHSLNKVDGKKINRYILDNISYRTGETAGQLHLESRTQARKYLMERVMESLEEKTKKIGSRQDADAFIRMATLAAIDEAWVEEVDYLQQLQSAVAGRSSAQRNLIHEFQNDAYESFSKMQLQIRHSIQRNILLSEVHTDQDGKLRIIFP